MNNYLITLLPDSADSARQELTDAFNDIKIRTEEYWAAHQEKCRKAEEAGEPIPPFIPLSNSIVISAKLLCAICGIECGKLDMPGAKGIDGALAELAQYSSNCGNH